MKKKILLFVLPVVFLMASAFTTGTSKYFEISKNIEIFANMYKEINTHYVDELDPSKLMKVGIDAMLESLDPYTNYWSDSQMEGFRYLTNGAYDGIGARSKDIDGFITILEVYEKSPAVKAGLKVGDRIKAINGESAKGRSTQDVNSIVRGAPGTDVNITVTRPGQDDDLTFTLTRKSVNIPNVPFKGMVSDGVGYISLTTFTRDAGRSVANALRDLKTEDPDLKGVVLDLRGNGGGLLREAINVCNVFIPKGEPVVSTKGKVVEWDKAYSTRNDPVDMDIPLIVLINKSSASASEIVSGVIQDLDRGVLVGQRSFGKGLVQNTRDIGYNARVKMTTAKYYIPSGRCIQSVEYEKGEPVDIPDEERAKFETRNGRTVLDGGGVKPDVFMELQDPPTIVKRLKWQNKIFKYVTQFCLENDSIPNISDFSFDEYEDFVGFLSEEEFKYQTETEIALKQLLKKAKKESVNEELDQTVDAIKDELAREKGTHIEKYKDEIVDLIEMDIATRYYYQNGRVQQQLKNDKELTRAIELINNKTEYNKILEGTM